MVFSSLQFCFLFLPIAIMGYYLINDKLKNFFLLVASLVFYAWGEPRFVFVMMTACIWNGLLALGMYRWRSNKAIKKAFLVLTLILDVGLLVVFKYVNFFSSILDKVIHTGVTSIVLPIGISFYSFQMISYVIDAYRNPEEYVCKNIVDLGLYISFFPQLIAGPIVRFKTIIDQIHSRRTSFVLFGSGVERFVIGMSKKMILANNMSIIADKAFALAGSDLSTGFAWLGAIGYTFQIYFDFSGYSDMAIGLGKMFGFEFDENFRYPYIADSLTDFWKRWHISLSSWFRDYVYIPLGGDGRNSGRKNVRGGV